MSVIIETLRVHKFKSLMNSVWEYYNKKGLPNSKDVTQVKLSVCLCCYVAWLKVKVCGLKTCKESPKRAKQRKTEKRNIYCMQLT